MLSILYSEYMQWGCPNCGCDSASLGNVLVGGLTSGTCRHCGLRFELRSKNPTGTCKYGVYPLNPASPTSEYVKEEAIRIDHPRQGMPSWHWKPVDVPPKEGEYWYSRGPGYPDVSGFVKTKAAGERILAIVKEVLGVVECQSFLDYRPSEPTWIQFKFHQDEFDMMKLDKLCRENNNIITKEIITQCVWRQ